MLPAGAVLQKEDEYDKLGLILKIARNHQYGYSYPF
jgi:hypothetical protein